MGKIQRTQIFFDEHTKERKLSTGRNWSELVELGIRTAEKELKLASHSQPKEEKDANSQ